MPREAVYQQTNPTSETEDKMPQEANNSLRPRRMDEMVGQKEVIERLKICLLYTSPSPRDLSTSRMPSSA